MSAFLVSDETINALVAARPATSAYAAMSNDELAQMLFLENLRSLQDRYGTPIERADVDSYRYRAPADSFHPAALMKLSACYAYQACESVGWERSTAFAFIQELEAAQLAQLDGLDATGVQEHPVYRDTPWGL